MTKMPAIGLPRRRRARSAGAGGRGCDAQPAASGLGARCGSRKSLRQRRAFPQPEPAVADLAGLVNLLAPFFGLIALGFFCGKTVRRPASGLAWMQFFLIYVALPCLFYRLIADKPLAELANWPFIAATTTATFLAFALSFSAGSGTRTATCPRP